MELRYVIGALIAAGIVGKMAQEAGLNVWWCWVATIAAGAAVCAYGAA